MSDIDRMLYLPAPDGMPQSKPVPVSDAQLDEALRMADEYDGAIREFRVVLHADTAPLIEALLALGGGRHG